MYSSTVKRCGVSRSCNRHSRQCKQCSFRRRYLRPYGGNISGLKDLRGCAFQRDDDDDRERCVAATRKWFSFAALVGDVADEFAESGERRCGDRVHADVDELAAAHAEHRARVASSVGNFGNAEVLRQGGDDE